ncbi:histidine kinase [Micromonospora sp. KC723]|uniref:ATP-binding protein n=1 Tax=Micromonospora sp. KC723 TaxID=2530381 RepID=UPI001053CC00|nr:histidine kinase [Micromonospora sp. KC723]TDB77958.1 sensor histidine kinase [Micromonospora sp. KC723]
MDVLLWLALVAAVVADSAPRWSQVAAGVAWSGLVVVTGRRWPGWALLVGAAANLVQLWEPSESEVWPVLVSAVAGLSAGRRVSATVPAAAVFSVVAMAGLAIAAAMDEVWGWLNVAVTLLFFGVLPWLAGRYRQLRALLAAAGWQRAEQLERERSLVAREARLRERTRIARDMHDSLGHELSLIAMRAGALELDRGLAEPYRSVLGELRAASVEATERLREIVGVLRDESNPAPVEPRGGTVAELVARSRASGARVELVTTGVAGAVPAAVDRTAHRVVREALTNAVKHAPGAAVTVRLTYGAAALTVTVTNGRPSVGAPPAAVGGGQGLPGLRERARLVGGALRAGARDGGYEVVAELPYAGLPTGRGADESEDSDSTRHLSQVRRAARRGMAAAVAVPGSIGTVVLMLMFGIRGYEVKHSFLAPAAYDALRVGQQRPDIAAQLPPQQVDGRPDVPEPPVPAGARCEYYRVTRDLFAGPIDVYRLCFVDGRLVDKTVVAGTVR